MKSISQVIRDLVVAFEMTPAEINHGYCADFAHAIWEKFGRDYNKITFTDTVDAGGEEESIGWHVWIIYQGKHYDAACPDGVKDWKDLPIWKT